MRFCLHLLSESMGTCVFQLTEGGLYGIVWPDHSLIFCSFLRATQNEPDRSSAYGQTYKSPSVTTIENLSLQDLLITAGRPCRWCVSQYLSLLLT